MICLTSTLSMYIFTLPISELDDADTDIVTLPVTVEPAAGFVIETNGDAVTTLLMLIPRIKIKIDSKLRAIYAISQSWRIRIGSSQKHRLTPTTVTITANICIVVG